ncbi:DoxX family protein [Hydrogenophaga crassostreae]|uniref:DoxX family protein n=1 Tax=Hydrogenophaga crassostreae TaxID=1763535 RepID=A0A167HJD5_9BURK|nr:DoxX family protein [Hydrogenophaga crassostreae]AOW15337.1 DoxX family protein [Hydrogenophaga crassostreae]OAD41294.1 DoxX family protein [Hydrogenophaga crassostreae]
MLLSTYEIHCRALLRIVTALLFMQHGAQKLFHYPPGGHHQGPLDLFSLIGVAGVLEFFGGLLLVVGLYTRSVAFVLSGQMAVAYFAFHVPGGKDAPGGFFPVVNGGELAIIFCFVFFYLVFSGPGAWSLDGLIKAKAPRAATN